MRTIFKMTKLELSNLFYSPIAWMILVLFIFQTGSSFGELLLRLSKAQFSGSLLNAVSANLFYSSGGIYSGVVYYLYLYIPLLTMGLLSQEFSRGSIKLLFSAPISSFQIVVGKFFAIMTYGLLLMGVLFVYILIAGMAVPLFDWPAVLSGLLGLYLLLGAYAAIGLFMSSLTRYQIVAAISTFMVFGVLNYMRFVGQDMAFLRELTYWMCLQGRVWTFIRGMICSEDVIYFLMIMAMFITFCIFRLRFERERHSSLGKWCRYGGTIVVVMLIGYITSRPVLKFYYDGTSTKDNTLTKASQDIVAKLDGGLKITAYSNMLDNQYPLTHRGIMEDMKRYENYTRFKPEIDLKYVFYYDDVYNPSNTYLEKRYPNMTPSQRADSLAYLRGYRKSRYLSPEELREKIDLSDEGNHFVAKVERDNGDYVYLRIFNDPIRFPSEAEISAALKRLVMKLPNVAFLTGQEEPSITGERNRDYTIFANSKYFRYSLVNQGFDVEERTLLKDKNNLENIDVLVIADPQRAFEKWELEQLYRYIDAGNDVIIAGEFKQREFVAPLLDYLGLRYAPGVLVGPTEDYPADLMLCTASQLSAKHAHHYRALKYSSVTMPGVMAIDSVADKGFEITPVLFTKDSACWNEMETIDFVNDPLILNQDKGEVQGHKVTAVGLSRKVGERDQHIMVLGDADCLSMGELAAKRRGIRAGNFNFITGMFYWMADGEAPLDVRRPHHPDNRLNMKWETAGTIVTILKWGIPILVVLGAILLLVRRKRK